MPGKSTLPLSANKSKERTGRYPRCLLSNVNYTVMYSNTFVHYSSTSDSKKRRDHDIQKISIWPEWTEAELAAEKWVSALRGRPAVQLHNDH